MKNLSKTVLTFSILSLGLLSITHAVHAAPSCGEAVTDEARLAADDDTGADPDLMTEECLAIGSTVKAIGQNKYSVAVDCGDMPEMVYDVTVTSQDGGQTCNAVDAEKEK